MTDRLQFGIHSHEERVKQIAEIVEFDGDYIISIDVARSAAVGKISDVEK